MTTNITKITMLLIWITPMKNMHIKHVKEHIWKEATWHDKKISKISQQNELGINVQNETQVNPCRSNTKSQTYPFSNIERK